MLDVFLGIGLCACGLLAAMALRGRADTPARQYLAGWLAAYGLFFLGWVGALRIDGAAGYALAALASSSIMAAPALQWFYARAVAGEPVRRRGLHLLPALINFALMITLGAASMTVARGGAIALNLPRALALTAIAPIIVLAAVSAYPALAWRTAARAETRLRNDRADDSVRAFAWIKTWAVAALALNAALIGSSIAVNLFAAPLTLVVAIAIAAVSAQVAFVAHHGLQAIAPSPNPAANLTPPAPSPAPQLAPADIETFERLMRTEKPFLDAGLTADALADRLGWPREKITAAVRTHGDSFFDCINRYRIDEAKRLIDDPQNATVSLLAISMDAGFGSKSSFNAAFRRHAGVTPTQYRRQGRTV